MPTTIIIDSVTLTLKKYPEFLAGTPASTDIILYADPTTGDLKKTTLDTLVANEVHVDGITITGDGTAGNPLVAVAARFGVSSEDNIAGQSRIFNTVTFPFTIQGTGNISLSKTDTGGIDANLSLTGSTSVLQFVEDDGGFPHVASITGQFGTITMKDEVNGVQHSIRVLKDSINFEQAGNANLFLYGIGLPNTPTSNVVFYDTVTGQFTYDTAAGGGLAQRFGVSGEDDTAGELRLFNINGFFFTITNSDVVMTINPTDRIWSAHASDPDGKGLDIRFTTGVRGVETVASDTATGRMSNINVSAIGNISLGVGLPDISTGSGAQWQLSDIIDGTSAYDDGSSHVKTHLQMGTEIATIESYHYTNDKLHRFVQSTNEITLESFKPSDNTQLNLSLFFKQLPSTTTSDVLFYNSTTGHITYGASSGVGTDTNFANTDLTASGNRTHTFAANTCEITFNTLAGGTGFAISATTTAATGSLQKLATIALGGVNANTGETSYALTVNNTHTGTNAANYGIYSNVTGGVINYAVYATSSTSNAIAVQGYTSASGGVGVVGVSDLGTGINGQSGGGGVAFEFIVSNNSNSTVSPIGRIERYVSSGGGADGIGVSVDFIVETATDNNYQTSNQIISKWTTATTASRVSQCIITGVNSAVSGDILTLNGNKSVQFNGYGSGTFTGTAAKWLAVDSSGNIIEQAPPSAGTGKYIPLAVISSPVTFSSGADNAVLTYAMPANTLNTNGQRVRFVAGMIHTVTSSTNDFRLAFTGGNAGSMDTTTSSQISYHAELIRRSSTEAEVVTFKTKTDGTCDIITKTVSGLDWTSIVTFHFYVSINGSGSVVTHMCALDFIDAP